MDPEQRLQELIEQGILTQAGQEALQLAPGFEEAIESQESSDCPDDSLPDDPVIAAIRKNASLLSMYTALGEYVDVEGYSVGDRAQLLTAIARFRNSAPTDGAPDAFLSVRGNHLPGLLGLYERSIVFLWREECDPCDEMRSTLDNVFQRIPSDIALFSVYGPDWSELLQKEYNVVGAPTTLFVLDGRVDARLQGAHEVYKMESETRKLRELCDSSLERRASQSSE